jgi:hypothetical protein
MGKIEMNGVSLRMFFHRRRYNYLRQMAYMYVTVVRRACARRVNVCLSKPKQVLIMSGHGDSENVSIRAEEANIRGVLGAVYIHCWHFVTFEPRSHLVRAYKGKALEYALRCELTANPQVLVSRISSQLMSLKRSWGLYY